MARKAAKPSNENAILSMQELIWSQVYGLVRETAEIISRNAHMSALECEIIMLDSLAADCTGKVAELLKARGAGLESIGPPPRAAEVNCATAQAVDAQVPRASAAASACLTPPEPYTAPK
jgi:hypothetical protein